MDLTVGAIDNWPENHSGTIHPQLICVCYNYLTRSEDLLSKNWDDDDAQNDHLIEIYLYFPLASFVMYRDLCADSVTTKEAVEIKIN